MNNLITTLFDNHHLLSDITFGSFQGINDHQDINSLYPNQLEDLAHNLIIDFNDQFDPMDDNHNSFWNTYLEPIAKLLK
jgi:hypothetical protein